MPTPKPIRGQAGPIPDIMTPGCLPGRKWHAPVDKRTRLKNDPEGDWLVESQCKYCGKQSRYKCIFA